MWWFRAIARVNANDGSHGTGFLVSKSGLLLTAFHVVGKLEQSCAEDKAIYRGADPTTSTVKIIVNGTESEAKVHGDCIDFHQDWVVLQCNPAKLGDFEPIPLAKFDPSGPKEFHTWGYPVAREPVGGGTFKGEVLRWDREPSEAYVQNTTADPEGRRGDDMGGISGAPLIVDGRAVGIIIQSHADVWTGKIVTNNLYVRPIDQAASKLGVPWDNGEPVEFQDIVAAKLPDDRTRLKDVSAQLGMTDVSSRKAIARGLLAASIPTAARALSKLSKPHLPDNDALTILGLIASMRLHKDAIDKVSKPIPLFAPLQVQPPPSGFRIYKWHVQRAYQRVPAAIDGRSIVVLTLSSTGAETAGPAAPAVIERVRAFLVGTRKLGSIAIADALSEKPTKSSLVWLVLRGGWSPQLVAELKKRPNLVIVLAEAGEAIDASTLASIPDACAVAPLLSESEQRELLVEVETASGDLSIEAQLEAEP